MIDWDKHPTLRVVFATFCFSFITFFSSLGFYMAYKVNNPTPRTEEEIKNSFLYKTMESFSIMYEGYQEHLNEAHYREDEI